MELPLLITLVHLDGYVKCDPVYQHELIEKQVILRTLTSSNTTTNVTDSTTASVDVAPTTATALTNVGGLSGKKNKTKLW